MWFILDNMQTSFFDHKQVELADLTTKWLREIEIKYPDMETI